MNSEISMWVGEFHRAVDVKVYEVEKTPIYTQILAVLIKPTDEYSQAGHSLREITGILSNTEDSKTRLTLAFDEKFPGSAGHTRRQTRTKYSGTVFGSPKVEDRNETCCVTVCLVYASESYYVGAATWE